jgi:hypothetical protein
MNPILITKLLSLCSALITFALIGAQSLVLSIWALETVCGGVRPVQLIRIGLATALTGFVLIGSGHFASRRDQSQKASSITRGVGAGAMLGFVFTALPAWFVVSAIWIIGLWDSRQLATTILQTTITLAVTSTALLTITPVWAQLRSRTGSPRRSTAPHRFGHTQWIMFALMPVCLLAASMLAEATFEARCRS